MAYFGVAHCDLQNKLCVYLETVASVVPINRSLWSHPGTDNLAYVLCLLLVYKKTWPPRPVHHSTPTDPDAFLAALLPQWTVPPDGHRFAGCLPVTEGDGNAG